ncbi:hypothetical protein FACS1894122_10920 [Alphaproteobacteria bacterium]|nr:hypothetical protein FACS1894122_10920 [Alphaproteobacteria bacterium]
MNKTPKTQSKKTMDASSKPSLLAKIIYSGLVRLKESKKAQESGRNCPKALDFGQPERVNVTTSKVD